MIRASLALAALLVSVSACAGDDSTDDNGEGEGEGEASGEGEGEGGGEPPGLEGITQAHIEARATVGVPPLRWSEALAATAQAYADACVDQEAPAGLVDHNPNRSDGHPYYVGENIYGTGGTPLGTDAVALWLSEGANYDYATNSCAGNCGHYTQLVWAASQDLGCGISTCPLAFGGTVVCNYGPGGNDGNRPY